METWSKNPMWTHNLCMSIKLTPVYKSVTLTVQGKCTKCTRGIKGCLCGGFQLILNKFFSCHQVIALSCHIFLHHTLILCTLLNSHIVIQILWCSVKIFVFTFIHPFLYQIMKYGSHILCEHIMYTCRWNLHHCTKVLH